MTAKIEDQPKLQVEIEEHRSPLLRDLPLSLKTLARFPLLALIRFYQLTISKTLPTDTCRFYPTCSHYTYQAIYKYGVFKGGWLGFTRILRCNPFNPGGVDPVP
jgi:putative membrane protein insertion efficiency factor